MALVIMELKILYSNNHYRSNSVHIIIKVIVIRLVTILIRIIITVVNTKENKRIVPLSEKNQKIYHDR